jgi:hypothetical protein
MSGAPRDTPVPDLGHGPRLSDEEYERRVVRLHEALPPMPSREQDREVRRVELDLAVDHRLGRDFPDQRRHRLWQIMEDVEKRRLRLIGRFLIGRLFARRAGPVKAAHGLAGVMVDRFAEVLDERELESFFGEEWQSPALPVDHEPRSSNRSAR